MPSLHTRRVARTVIAALFLGGLCGAAVGLGYVPPAAGVLGAGAVAIALLFRLRTLRGRRPLLKTRARD